MQIKDELHKTKNFFHRNLQTLKSVLFGRRKPSSSNPFSCSACNPKAPQPAQVYTDSFEDDHIIKPHQKQPAMKEEVKLEKKSPERSKKERTVKEKKTATSYLRKGDGLSSRSLSSGTNILAKKMKELDMVESGDLEQVLDIEEAVHYYSRLKSPVYLDIVDNFLTDMYSTSSVNSSKRRIGSRRF